MKIFTRSMNLFLALCLALVGLAFAPAQPAQASTEWTVCATSCNFTSLAAAIADGSVSDGDTIRLGNYAAYNETLGANLVINKSLTILGAGKDITIISGGDLHNITIAATKTVNFKDLTITNGRTTNSGGAIVNNGTLTIENVVIKDSVSQNFFKGGGIYNNGGLTILNSVIENNQAHRGGGIFNEQSATLSIDSARITDNISVAEGGGINILPLSGTVIINGAVIDGNTSSQGGGIYADSAFTLTNSAVFGNTSTTSGGGGIYFGGDAVTAELKNVTVSGNSAPGASGRGGGIQAGLGKLILNNVTIANNTAQLSGGGLVMGSYQDYVDMSNSILANNTSNAGTEYDDCAWYHTNARINSLGHNLIENPTNCNSRIIGPKTNDIYNTDPKLDALEYLGTTYVHYPQYDSPVVDAGDNTTCELKDQVGDDRPMGPACDIGAAEFVSAGMVINNSGDPNVPGSLPWTYAHSLGYITFHPSLAGQTITLTAPITFTDTATIDGYSLHPNTPVTISGGGTTSIFEVGSGVYATLTRLNLVNGYNATDGGAIFNNGTLYLDTVQFSNNTAVGKGGAIYNEGGGTLVMGASTFTNNSAEDGGAIYSNNVNLSIETSTFNNNTALLRGGGIMAFSSEITITGSSFTGNIADDAEGSTNNDGGAISTEDGDLQVTRSSFTNNSTPGNPGGAIYLQDNSATFTETLFEANYAKDGGAIWSLKSSGVMSITIEKSTFKNNQAISTFYGQGGAIRNEAADLTVKNSTFSGNNVTSDTFTATGGAIYNQANNNLFISHSTFSGNTLVNTGDVSTFEGGAVYDTGDGAFEMHNSILANSVGGSDCFADGSLTSSGNLIETNATLSPCGTPASTADPKLGPLANNGGYTQTFRLLPGSPAIDTANPDQCEAADQRGITRPQDGDLNGTSICDMGAYEANPQKFVSVGAQDGWVLEAGETGNIGGKLNKGGKVIHIGDDAANQQYVGVLSFNTISIPTNAVIQSAVLKFKDAGKTGTLPFGTHGQLLVDVRKGPFSNNAALQLGDFNAKGTKNNLFSVSKTTVNKWYSKAFAASQFKFINKTGVTQFRLRFKLDDNNDLGADFLKIHSGNSGAANRPQLIIEYYVP